MTTISKTFAANIETVPKMMEYVEGLVKELPAKTAYEVTLACEEVLVNIVSYAYPEKDGQLIILWENDIKNRILKFSFEDFGIPFNPFQHEEPDLSLPLERRNIGGLGIMIVRKLMDTVQYSCDNGKNTVTLTKEY